MEMVFLLKFSKFLNNPNESFNPCFDGNGLLAKYNLLRSDTELSFNPCFDGNGLLAQITPKKLT